MAAGIDPTARIGQGASIGRDVAIGPYCVVGPEAEIGDGCRLVAHVHVTGRTRIGPGTVVYPFASLGTPPQSVSYRGEPTELVVGADCDIREGVTMNIGTAQGGGVTRIGDRCFFMANSHVGHDGQVGSRVIVANNVAFGGHVTVGDDTFLGGGTMVHQFVRIGEGAMIAGLSGVRADVIPFSLVQGGLAQLVGLNVIGLRRRGQTSSALTRLRRAYRSLFFGPGRFQDRVEATAEAFADDEAVGRIVAFIRAGGKRPLTFPRKPSRVAAAADAESA